MNWQWSFRAFRLFGVDVRVHWSLPAFFLYYLLRGEGLGYSWTTLGLFIVLPMVLLFLSVVAHEFGHVFAARRFRLHVGHMVLSPIGGMVLVAQGRTPVHELVVAAAGPCVNLVLAIVVAAVYLTLGGPADLGLFVPFVGDGAFGQLWAEQRLLLLVLYDFVQVQMGLFLFNVLVTAYPMDGGRVLMSLLWRRRGFQRALTLSCKVSRVLAGALLVAAFVLRAPLVGVIAVLVFFQADATLKRAPVLADPSRGYDAGFERAIRRQAEKREAERRERNKKSSFLSAWLRKRNRDRVRAVLAKAESQGIASLTAGERGKLKRAWSKR